MALVDFIFLGILGVSVLTSAYVVAEFLYSARKARKEGADAPEAEVFSWKQGAAEIWMEERVVTRVARSRSRRSGSSSGAPDLLTVTGTGYAVTLLPVRQTNGDQDVVESRLFFN